MRNSKAPRCILGVFVIALFLAIVWSTTTAQLSTITSKSPAFDAGSAAVATAGVASATTSAVVIDSAPNISLEALPGIAMSAAVMSPPAPPKANLDQVRNGSAQMPPH
jgi:hypothetical protein